MTIRDFDELSAYESWSDKHPELATALPTSQTSRGRHVYLRSEHRGITVYADGELRGAGYCLLPPSKHPTGADYEWVIPPSGELPTLDPFAVGLGVHPPTDIEKAVTATLPTGAGQREHRLFELARRLRGVDTLRGATEAVLRDILARWHKLALPTITTKDFGTTWTDFLRAWSRVEHPAVVPAEKGVQIVPKLLDRRGRTTFTLTLNGSPVTSETYRTGDGESRRRVARRWSADGYLNNGQAMTAEEIESTLFSVETAATARVDSDDDDAGGVCQRQAASYVSDDLIAELAWNTETAAPDFIIYHRETGETSRTSSIEMTGETIIVPVICPGIVTPGGDISGSVYLPTDVDAAGEDEDSLRYSLRRFIDRYVELPGEAAAIVCEYVLMTWTHDVFDELPYLAFRTADLGRGKSRALETVGAACYRPIFAGGGSSAAATLRLIDVFGGTLISDEFDKSKDTEIASEITQLLNQGFQRNRPLVRCDGESNSPRPFRCFGPKIFALRNRLADDATESRTLSVRMVQRTRKDIPISLPRRQFDRESLALRNQLLSWRFTNYGKITPDPALADPRLEDRGNQIATPLLAVARDVDHREAIVDALLSQQNDVAADREDSAAGEVFAAIETIGKVGGTVRPGDVAAEVNRVRAAAEGCEIDKLKFRMSAYIAGRLLLGTLELPRCEKDNRGSRYNIDKDRWDLLTKRYAANVTTSPQTSLPKTPLALPKTKKSDVSDVSDVSGERAADILEGGDGSFEFGHLSAAAGVGAAQTSQTSQTSLVVEDVTQTPTGATENAESEGGDKGDVCGATARALVTGDGVTSLLDGAGVPSRSYEGIFSSRPGGT